MKKNIFFVFIMAFATITLIAQQTAELTDGNKSRGKVNEIITTFVP